jgi:CHAD domain-containing protein
MAFCFKRKELVSKGVRRLGGQRIEHALHSLRDCHEPNAIHSVRKDIKRVRAVLRLMRTEIRKKDYRRMLKSLRNAAMYLAGPRDAHVKSQALSTLMQVNKGQLGSATLRQVRASLRDEADTEMKKFAKDKTAKEVARSLEAVAEEFRGLKVKQQGWRALSMGVKTAFQDGKRAFQRARRAPTADNLHEWRKRAKDLWYQATLLRRIWPEQMEAMARDLEVLGENLGDYHDLVVLLQAVKQHTPEHAREVESLRRQIEERQGQLCRAALGFGEQFYAEKPDVFCRRLAEYWLLWRRNKRRSPAGRPTEKTLVRALV